MEIGVVERRAVVVEVSEGPPAARADSISTTTGAGEVCAAAWGASRGAESIETGSGVAEGRMKAVEASGGLRRDLRAFRSLAHQSSWVTSDPVDWAVVGDASGAKRRCD